MKVGIIAPLHNSTEKKFVADLIKKIKAIGFEAEVIAKDLSSYTIAVVVFDGRALLPQDYIKLGQLTQLRAEQVRQAKTAEPKKMIVGYLTTGADRNYLAEEKSILDHLATTELNLISCLKDYIYYHQHGQANAS